MVRAGPYINLFKEKPTEMSTYVVVIEKQEAEKYINGTI
jgi:hypothetical protein